MREIVLNASPWATEIDLIEAIIKSLGGPDWHGRNYNALYDSIVFGSINEIEPPYEFVITHAANANLEVREAIDYFAERIAEWRARDHAEVAVRIEA